MTPHEKAHRLINELSAALQSIKREDLVLRVFKSVEPELADAHVRAIGGDLQVAALALVGRWPNGNAAVTEYVCGDTATVLESSKVLGQLVRAAPAMTRNRKRR